MPWKKCLENISLGNTYYHVIYEAGKVDDTNNGKVKNYSIIAFFKTEHFKKIRT